MQYKILLHLLPKSSASNFYTFSRLAYVAALAIVINLRAAYNEYIDYLTVHARNVYITAMMTLLIGIFATNFKILHGVGRDHGKVALQYQSFAVFPYE